jgi:hypothetical protein
LAWFWAEIVENEVFLTFWVIFLTDTVIEITDTDALQTDTVTEITYTEALQTDTVIEITYTEALQTDTVIVITYTEALQTDTVIEITYTETLQTDTITDTTDTEVKFPGFWTGQRTKIRRRGTLGSYCPRVRADARPCRWRLDAGQRLEQRHFRHGHLGGTFGRTAAGRFLSGVFVTLLLNYFNR